MPTILSLAACRVDLPRGTVHRPDGSSAALTTREVELLRFLADSGGRVVRRDELLVEVWGYSDAVVSRACDNAVRRLREKIEADPGRPDHVLTVHGAGYRFVGDATAPSVSVAPAAPAPVALGPVQLDLHRLRVLRPGDVTAPLTAVEGVLLRRLLEADGAVVSREELARAGWKRVSTRSRVVDGAIHRLRAKLEPEVDQPRVLLTARGGYQLVLPEPVVAPRPDLVGRGALLQALRDALSTTRRVLLLGPGGVGKSSLARAIAAEAPGPVVWIDLATADRADAAAALAARALGVQLSGRDPVERVGAALAARRGALVVLDNLEGLAGDAGAIERWAALAPGVRFLGTSRVRLAQPEAVLDVEPLEPEDAVALFVQRVQAATSRHRDLERHRDLVRRLVDRLDRLPLAIELAAARAASLGVEGLLDHLSVDLLSRPDAGADPRHRTMRGVIEASLGALPASAREALRDLVLFRAGATVDDARGVFGGDAFDLLQALRDHSLLRVEVEGARLRFDVWHVVRERLDEDGPPRPDRVRRHAAHLGRWGTAASLEQLGTAGTEQAVRRLREQVDDVARAARAALALGEVELAGRCASAAAWVYEQTGPYSVGIALVSEVLDRGRPQGELRARLQLQLGQLHRFAGQDDAAERAWRAAAGDEARSAWVSLQAEVALARWCRRRGRRDDCRRHAIAASEAAGRWDPNAGAVEWTRAIAVELDAAAEAGDLLERAFALAERSGQVLLAATIGAQIVDLSLGSGRHTRAAAAAAQAHRTFTAFGVLTGATSMAVGAADTALRRRDPLDAARWTEELRACAARTDSPLFQALAQQLSARSCLLGGDLAGAEAAMRAAEAAYAPPPPLLAAQTEEIWTELERRRGDPQAATAHGERSWEGYRRLTGFSHAAAVGARAAVAWIAAGDLERARGTLDASAEPDVPRLPPRVAAELLLARAERRDADGDRLLAELHAALSAEPAADEAGLIAAALAL